MGIRVLKVAGTALRGALHVQHKRYLRLLSLQDSSDWHASMAATTHGTACR